MELKNVLETVATHVAFLLGMGITTILFMSHHVGGWL